MKAILLFFSAILFINALDAQIVDTIAIYDPVKPDKFISSPPNDIFNTRLILSDAISFSEVHINKPKPPDTSDKSNVVVFKNQLFTINRQTFGKSTKNGLLVFRQMEGYPLNSNQF